MDRAAAVVPSVGEIDPAGWLGCFDDMFAEVVAPAFVRREPRLRAYSYLLGLVSGLERKNGWTLAEFAGDATPDGMQRLLNAARWDADAVRDALRRYVTARLGDPGGVLIGDETGFEKSGVHSAGVQRQYTGTAGKITNCQVGVFLSLCRAEGAGRWSTGSCTSRGRGPGTGPVAGARMPGGHGVPTKPQLLQRWSSGPSRPGCRSPGSPPTRPTADNGPLRACLERRSSPTCWRSRVTTWSAGPHGRRADKLPRRSRRRGMAPMRCGTAPRASAGMTGRWPTPGPAGDLAADPPSLTRPSELAFYLCWYTAAALPLAVLVKVAGARWAWRSASRPPRTRPRWTTTRSASSTSLVQVRHPGHARPGLARRHRRGEQAAARLAGRRRSGCW